MPPPSRVCDIERHTFGKLCDRELIGGKADSRRGRLLGVFEERPQQANSAKLNRNTQAVMISPMFGDEGAVRIIEMEMPVELIVRRLASEASVSPCLILCKKANWHP
jgi:hypothetical protein